MKRAWNYAMTMWQPAGVLLIGVLFVTFLFTWRLGNLVPGATVELQTRTQSNTLPAIIDNPINAPYKTAVFVSQRIHSGITTERFVSSIVAGLSVLVFFLVVRHFSSRLAATAGTLLYATSSTLLHNGRLAVPNVMLLLLLALLACGYRLRFSNHRTRSWLMTAAILALSLYTPGLIYFIVIGALWQARAIRRSFELPDPSTTGASIVVFIGLLTPLIWGFVQHPDLWRSYFLIPAMLPQLKDFALQILAVPAGILAFAPRNPLFRLGRQPSLDVFAVGMFIIGGYTLLRRYKLDRLPMFIGIFTLGILLTALSGDYEFSLILLPFVYLIIATGIDTMLDGWRRVFPFNPLARSVAIIIMLVAVVISSNFQAWRYFVAWPHNDETKAVFTLK
jgi:hypothetical protein